MSTDLHWRPVPREVPPARRANALKHRLGRRLWGHDGTLIGDMTVAGPELVPYLEGLRDAGDEATREEADELIEAIREHGGVELWIAP